MSEKLLASDSISLTNNPAFKAAIGKMETYLEAKALSADPDNKDACSRIVISKQILKGIVRELERLVADGEVIQLKELDRRKKTIKERVFQR